MLLAAPGHLHLDCVEKIAHLEGLLQVVPHPQLQGADRVGLGGIAGNHQAADVGTVLLDLLQGVQAAHPLHADVGDDQVEALLGGHGHGLGAGSGGGHLVALVLEHLGQRLAQRGVVFEQEDPTYHSTSPRFWLPIRIVRAGMSEPGASCEPATRAPAPMVQPFSTVARKTTAPAPTVTLFPRRVTD